MKNIAADYSEFINEGSRLITLERKRYYKENCSNEEAIKYFNKAIEHIKKDTMTETVLVKKSLADSYLGIAKVHLELRHISHVDIPFFSEDEPFEANYRIYLELNKELKELKLIKKLESVEEITLPTEEISVKTKIFHPIVIISPPVEEEQERKESISSEATISQIINGNDTSLPHSEKYKFMENEIGIIGADVMVGDENSQVLEFEDYSFGIIGADVIVGDENSQVSEFEDYSFGK